jgi:hypothetical protein
VYCHQHNASEVLITGGKQSLGFSFSQVSGASILELREFYAGRRIVLAHLPARRFLENALENDEFVVHGCIGQTLEAFVADRACLELRSAYSGAFAALPALNPVFVHEELTDLRHPLFAEECA